MKKVFRNITLSTIWFIVNWSHLTTRLIQETKAYDFLVFICLQLLISMLKIRHFSFFEK